MAWASFHFCIWCHYEWQDRSPFTPCPKCDGKGTSPPEPPARSPDS